MPGQDSGITPLPDTQSCRLFVVIQFGPDDAALSTEPGGDRGTLFACKVVQGYVRAFVLPLFVLCLFYLFVFAKHFPPRGAESATTFHPGYLSFFRLTPPPCR